MTTTPTPHKLVTWTVCIVTGWGMYRVTRVRWYPDGRERHGKGWDFWSN